MAGKAAFFLCLALLQEVNADWTTTIKTNIIIPNTVTAVVDFVTSPPSGSTPTVLTSTHTPAWFDTAISHKERFSSAVTVPDGKLPTIHFSLITPTGKPVASTPPSSSATHPAGDLSDTTVPSVPPGNSNSPSPSDPSGKPPGTTSDVPKGTPSVSTGAPNSHSPSGSSGTSSGLSSDAPQGTPSHTPSASGSPPPPNSSGVPNENTQTNTRPKSGSATGGLSPSGHPGSTPVPTDPTGEKSSNPPAGTSTSSKPIIPSSGTSAASNSAGPSPSQATDESSGVPASGTPGSGTSGINSNTSPQPGNSGSHSQTTKPSGGTTSGTSKPTGLGGSSSSASHEPSDTSASGKPTDSDSSSSGLPASSSDRGSISISNRPTSGASSGASRTNTDSPASSGSSTSSMNPSDQVSSADLASVSDLDSAAATGSDSAIGDYMATGSPTSQPWATLTDSPSSTITGEAEEADSSHIAVLLSNTYNNIDDLKKDPKKYKKHIDDLEEHTNNYISKTGYDSSKSPCSSSKRSLEKRGLFSAIGDIASDAAKATVDTASDIANAALSCVAPITTDIKGDIPDDTSKVTDDVINNVKKGTEYLEEISNIVKQMEDKAKEDNDHSSSSSSSDSSTTSESSTSTCESSTTYSDCTWSTIVSAISDSPSGSMSTSSTEICDKRTACEASPTTMSTITTIGSCEPIKYLVTPAPPVPITASDYGGSGTAEPGSDASTSGAPSTTPPGSKMTTSTTASSTTTKGPECPAHQVINQAEAWTYCMFECDAYTGSYPIAKSSSGDTNYQPCPYSRPPSTQWSRSNEGSFTTTESDGTVYYCGDSEYQDRNVGDSKSCVTSMSSVTVISSIYSSWSAKESAASASSASKASAASASSASAAAAATPTDQIFIAYYDDSRAFHGDWKIYHSGGIFSADKVKWCDVSPIGSKEASGDISTNDIPVPDSFNFGDDADVDDDFKDCTFDSDKVSIDCPNFSTDCKELNTDPGECAGIESLTDIYPKLLCEWGSGDSK